MDQVLNQLKIFFHCRELPMRLTHTHTHMHICTKLVWVEEMDEV